MKCLSFNCRGMASASKKLALYDIFEVQLSDIILLQETLGEVDYITISLTYISPGYHFIATDDVG